MRQGLRVDQAPLSVGKIHSWRSETPEQVEEEMPAKFDNGNGLLFELLASWNWCTSPELGSFPPSPRLGRDPKPFDNFHLYATAERAYAACRHTSVFGSLTDGFDLDGTRPAISDEVWCVTLFRCLLRARDHGMTPELFPAFRTLFFLRVATMLPRLSAMTLRDTDQMVRSIASGVRTLIRESL